MRREFTVIVGAQACTEALFFVLLEFLKACRSSQWSGTTLHDALGLAVGFSLYGALLAVSGLFLGVGFRRLSRDSVPVPTAAVGGVFFAGLLLWACLSVFREFSPTADDALVVGGLSLLSAIPLIGRKWLRLLTWEACVLCAVVLLGGIVALGAAGALFLFHPDRPLFTALYPLGWMAVAGGFGAIVWGFSRSRRLPVRLAHAVVAFLGPPLAIHGDVAPPARDSVDGRPNLVLVVSDTLRPDLLGAYGGPVPTPAVAALAAEGALFEQSYSLAPWTLPSMTAMFSSAYPPSLTPGVDGGVWVDQLWAYGIPPETKTLAEMARDAGYLTGALTANAFLPVIPGMLRGVEVTASAHPILLLRQGFFSHLPFLQDAIAGLIPAWDSVRPHDTTHDLALYTEAFLQRYRDRPFYLWVHLIDPHAPYDPPAAFRTEEGAWPFFYPYSGGERWGIPQLSADFNLPEKDRPYTASLYRGEVEYVDTYVQRLTDTLARLGLSDNTYVCFTSDHGEELWEHGGWGHGQSVHEELVRVPLIIAGPGLAPQRIAAPVSAVDLIPTLSELLGLEAVPEWRGISWAGALSGKGPPPGERPLFAQATSNKCWPYPEQAVRSGGYKLIRGLGGGPVRLYNLIADPWERNNLSAIDPETVRAMESQLDDWMATFPSILPVPDEQQAPGHELLEHLRGMGYL